MTKKLKQLISLLLVIALAASFAGCGNKTSNNSQATPEATKTPVSVEETTYPVTITDSFKKEVTLEQEPMKIVSAGPNITEMIYQLGAQDKLVGRTDYCDYPAEVTEIESIGALTTPDIEKIISLEPDMVIASTHFNEENAVKLEEAGIKVIALYEEYDVTGVYTMFETLGVALNKQSEAATAVEEMKAAIADVSSKVEGLEAPSVYYVVGYGEYGDFSAPANTFVGQLLKLAGGNNIVPESDSWSYSLEALLEADPEIIIVRNGDKEGFVTAEHYKELTAVKEDRVYEIDTNMLDRQGYRNAEGVKTLAAIFHPEAFK